LESGFIKLKTMVLIAGITKPARRRTSAGARNIVSATGRDFLPSTRPAIAKSAAMIAKKIAIATKTEVNFGTVVEMKSDISFYLLFFKPSLNLIGSK